MESFWSKLKRKSGQVMSIDCMISKTQGHRQLRRVLTLLDLVLFGVGSIVGSGVFVLTGEVAREHTGPAVIASYAISAVAALFCALCYAEFAADIPCSGAAYNYIGLVYGEFISWMAASGLLLEYVLSVSAVAKGFSGYLCTLFGADSDSLILTFDNTDLIVIDVVGATLVFLLSLLLWYGVRESFTFNIIATSVSLAIMLFTVCTSVSKIDTENYTPFFPDEFGFANTIRGASIVFFSYIGFDSVATVAEEVSNPSRDVPLSIVLSVAISTIFYVLMSVSIVGMVPYTEIDIRAPFSSAFKRAGWDWASRIVSLGALFGILTSVFAAACGTYRLIMVFGRDGFLPKWLSTIHPWTSTPGNATLVGGILTTLMTLFLDIDTLSSLVSMGTLFTFNLVCQGCIWRRYCGMSHVPSSVGVEPVKKEWLALRITLLVIISVFEGLAVDKKWSIFVWLATAVCFIAVTLSFVILPVLFRSEKFSLPLQPLVPCLGVLFSIHLIVTLETAAFIRFIVWQSIAVVIYLIYGVHHTDFVSQEQREQDEAPLIKPLST